MDYLLKTPEQLRQQLRSLRKKRGLTQARLGALIGVSQARVVEIEGHPGTVSLQQIMQVLHALGADVVLRDEQAAAPDSGAPAQGSGLAPSRQRSRTAPAGPAGSPGIAKKGSW